MAITEEPNQSECPFRITPVIKYLGKYYPPDLISCPTCGRCEVPNFFELAERVDNAILKLGRPIKVAVMGCVVNGPGEARDADVGIAFGHKGRAALFKKGKVIATIQSYDLAIEKLLVEVQRTW